MSNIQKAKCRPCCEVERQGGYKEEKVLQSATKRNAQNHSHANPSH
jgi:hypothetical protein